MKIFSAILAGLLFLSMTAAPTFAHHNVGAGFDESKATTLRGVLVKVDWTNPHVKLSLEVKNAGGKVTTWAIDLPSATNLIKAVMPANSFEITKSYSIEVWPARDGSRKAYGRKLTFPDGHSVDVSSKMWEPPIVGVGK